MSLKRHFFTVIFVIIASFFVTTHRAAGASILAQQSDGSSLGSIQIPCDNRCQNVIAGTQTFIALASGTIGSIRVFAAGFTTSSRYPDTNNCYLTLYDDEDGTELGISDNSFTGRNCGNPHMFTFKGSQPQIEAGKRYRWNYVLGEQNFSEVTFRGTQTDTINGSFSVAPLADAMFVIYAEIEPPTSLGQLTIDNGAMAVLPEGGSAAESTVAFTALLPSPLPDQLNLQVELKPSFIPFIGMANLNSTETSPDAASVAQTSATVIPNGGYHWQARSVDGAGNTSDWAVPSNSSDDADFFVENAEHEALLEDKTTTYERSTQPDPCFGDGSVFSCSLLPSSTIYAVPLPFLVSKVTFDWRNDGSNNCDGYGNYGVVIVSAEGSDNMIATSTNTAYLGCGRGESGTAELHFENQRITKTFNFSLGAFDGVLQGGSDVKVSNVAIYGTFQNASDTPPTDASTTPATTREPVVIVPGMLGSRLNERSDGTELWPNADAILTSLLDRHLDRLALLPDGSEAPGKEVYASDIVRMVTTSLPFSSQDFYGPLVESLISAGYREGTDLFVAPYDWRLDIATSATSLGPIFKNAIAVSPDGKIDIITHSMGGLLVKEYLTHATDTAFIDKLILVAPPQLGAASMFKTLQFGDDLGFRIGPIELLNPLETKKISQNMPGAYGLLPSRKYIATVGGYIIDNRNGNHVTLDFDGTKNAMTTPSRQGDEPRNAGLIMQADALHAKQDDFPFPAQNTYEIIGCQNPSTISQFVLQDGGGFDIIRTSGDGTVSIASAMNMANDHNNYFSLYSKNGADHLGLIRNAETLTLISALLKNETSSLTLASIGISTSTQNCFESGVSEARRETTVEVAIEGPAILEASDGQGKTTKTTEYGISKSIETKIGNFSSLMLPASDTYHITVKASATGTFMLKIRSYDETARLLGATTYIGIPISTSSTIEATIPPASSTFKTMRAPILSLARKNGDAAVLIAPTAILSEKESEDTTPPIVIIKAISSTVASGDAPITLSYSTTDENSGVATSSATLDGNPVSNGATATMLSTGTHLFMVTSIDNAGNPRTTSTSFTVAAAAPPINNISTTQNRSVGNTIVQVPQVSVTPIRHCRPRPTTTAY